MKFIIAFLISILITIQLALANNTQPAIKLYVFDCGYTQVNDKSIFSINGDYSKHETIKLANSCYLIQHGNQYLLWDAGHIDSLVTQPKGEIKLNGIFNIQVKKTLSSQLQEIGISPREVNYLAFSHMHYDHTGNANDFSSATWLVQATEYNAAFSEDAERLEFDPSTYSKFINNKVIKLNGDHDVFGDGSVVIYSAPGHTLGHQVLLVKLPNHGAILLSGDLYHFEENRTYKRIPTFDFNKEQSKKSIEKIENLVIKENATMWIQHDLHQNTNIKHAPAYYD